VGDRQHLENVEVLMPTLYDRLYDCEVLIARAERMKNWDAVARLTEYAESLSDEIDARS